jgi:dipeptidase E
MRLFLSSYRIGNNPEKLVELVGKHNKKVADITNAGDLLTRSELQERLDEDRAMFNDLGLQSEHLDLRNYFEKDPKELEEKLRSYGLIWVRGGNVFNLRQAMQRSGFDIAIKKLLAENAVVYGGYSAGACVLCPTLKGIDFVDDPDIFPEGYKHEVIWKGLGLVPYAIAPHYKSDHPESEGIDKVVDYYEKNNIPYKALRDGEVIFINGDTEELLK